MDANEPMLNSKNGILITLFLSLMAGLSSFQKNTHGIKFTLDSLLSPRPDMTFNGCVIIAKNDSILYQNTIGYKEPKSNQHVSITDQFVIGSVSKQFTAVLVLREIDAGRLVLDAPISKYLLGLNQSWADSVTVRHLLCHTHGISSLSESLAFLPGSRLEYNYANLGYHLLSEIVSKTSGKPFEKMCMNLFKLCGMHHTFHPRIHKYHNLIGGFTEDENGILKFDSNSFENDPAAGGMISTAQDLLKWNSFLHNNKLLSATAYKWMCTPQSNAVRQHSVFGITLYGLGPSLSGNGSVFRIGQTGFAPGYLSMNFYYPNKKMSVILLDNFNYHSGDFKQKFTYHSNVIQWLENGILIEKE